MKKTLLIALFQVLCVTSQMAHAFDLKVVSNDPVVKQDQFRSVVSDNLPASVKALGDNYRMTAVLETTPFRDNLSFYFYSVMLMRKVIEQGTGKAYWVQTGGIRSNGLTPGGDKLVSRIHDDMVAGSRSFVLDQ